MMRATLLQETLVELFKSKRPICVEGMPGGGKTTISQQVASKLGVGYIEKHTPTMLVEDFGVPDMATSDDSFKYKLPDWYPAEGRTDIPMRVFSALMIVTKHLLTSKRYWLTYFKHVHCMVYR